MPTARAVSARVKSVPRVARAAASTATTSVRPSWPPVRRTSQRGGAPEPPLMR